MNNLIKVAVLTGITLSAFSTLSATPEIAQAQSYRGMSCGALWYARNEIYARNGHCFKTRRGRQTFGRNCFPPYGRLSQWERRKVQRIIRAERRRGCR